MSAISQDTYAVQGIPLTGVGGGGASLNSTFSTIYVANEVITTTLASALTSTMILEAEEAFVSSISSFFINAVDIGCSSISTLGVVLDGNILTSAGNELLLNGIPIATNSSLSSIADWAIDPAISTLQMDGHPIIGSVGYTGTGTVSTTDIQAATGFVSTLVCSDISTITLTVQSTIHTISSISSLVVAADALFVSSINGGQYPPSAVSSFETTSVSSLTASSINGISYPPPNSDVSQWARFPAVSTITGGVGATDDLSIAVGRNLAINSRVSTAVVVDRGSDVGGYASFNVVTQNGNRGQINLTANPGFAGINGEVNITANGGTTPGLIGSGGLIQLTANTPIGTDPALTSAIKFSAAGINSYAGAIPSVGSLLGYNFVYGTLGVNLCTGIPSVFPNVPGTTYLYGTTGITLGSQTNTASDITQSAGGLYTTLVTGYWPGGVFAPSNLVIRGRQIPIYGNSYVQLSNVDVLSFDSGARKAITGLSTINGAAYPPAQTPLPPNLVVSTLTAATQVSTPALFVSSVNGGVYPPVFEPPANAIVSSLTAADYVSTARIYGVSTIFGESVTNNIVFDPNGGIIINNDGGDMIVDNAGSLTVRTDLIIPNYELLVSSIRGVSSINGSAYPPVFEPPVNAIVSTLTAANSVSTPALFVSSVNGVAYPPSGSVPADLVVSSLTAATSVVTFALNADIINTYPANAPVVSTLTAGTSVSTSALFVSSVNGSAYPPAFVPPTNLIISSLVVSSFTSTLALTVSSINGNTTSDPAVSTLRVAGNGNITLQEDPGSTSSAPIFFKSGNETVNDGILEIKKSVGYTDPSTRNYRGLAVDAYSTLGALQPVICASVLLNPTPNVFTGAPITGNTAGDVIFPMSTIVGISTINGAPYPAPVTSGIQSTIANGGSYVNVEAGGSISLSTLQSNTSADINIEATNDVRLGCEYGGIYLANNNVTTHVNLDNTGSVDIAANGSNSINLGSDGGITITGAAPGTVNIVNLSTINGAPYPPTAANVIQSTIANAGSFVDIDGAGNISSFSGGRTNITASQGGIHLIDADNVTTLDVMFDITMAPTSGAAVRINDAPLYVSTVYLSSINGAAYPPPGPGGSPNAEFSTLTVSSFASIPQITNVSSINDVNFNGGNIDAQTVTAEVGFSLAGAGTFTINGSTGGEGQVIQIVDGYPEWATPVRPAAYYSTSTESLPVFSTFSTVVAQDFTTQLSTGNCLVTGNVTILNGDIIGDTLTTNLFLTGSGAGTAISTTGAFAAGYQNISLQYLIPQASLNPPGTPNTFEINIKKPDTDNSYTVTYATISVTTDLN